MVESDLGAVPVAMRIRRIIKDVSGRHRVVIRQRVDGFVVEQWELHKKRWRKGAKWTRDSYFNAVHTASQWNPWVGQALMDELGTVSAVFLEMVRGGVFQWAYFAYEIFGDDHDHCRNCFVKFTGTDIPGVLHEGFVTKLDRPAGVWPWFWLCGDCFERFRDRLQWEVSLESVG